MTIQERVESLISEGKAKWQSETSDGHYRTLIGIAADGVEVQLGCLNIHSPKDWKVLDSYLSNYPTPEHW